jgi:methylated-DNA-[protein]-cysteine S-methyltransferase
MTKLYTLIGADGQPYSSPEPGTLGGHRRNRVYGRLDCPGALRWIARGHYVSQRVFFADEATAVAAGYRPCARCMPAEYRAWKEGSDPDMLYSILDSPVGPLLLSGDGEALTGLGFHSLRRPPAGWRCDDGGLAEARRQLEEYFAGERTDFDLQLRLEGSDFERRVWEALLEIPYGTTTTYGELAAKLGAPRGARAVGLANGRNPVAIVVPCHRVIGAGGKLTGYGGGLERKSALLVHEGALLAG